MWVTWCPLGEKCSRKGRQLCKFDTEEKVRTVVYNHLTNSPYHFSDVSEEEARNLADNAEVKSWEEEEEQDEEVKEPELQGYDEEEDEQLGTDEPPAKLLRVHKGDKGKGKAEKGKGKYNDKGKGKGKEGFYKGITKDDLTSAVASGMALALQSQANASSSSIVPQQSSFGIPGQDITMSSAKLKSIIDNINRCEASARSSARVADAAVAVFTKEADAMADARRSIEFALGDVRR